jgi:ribosomal protein L17
MKRRGFVPNVRTYATMMNGLAAIEDWEKFSKQLEYAQSLYAQLKQHLEQSRSLGHDTPGASFILYPICLYISILGKAGKYQKAFDAFHELDTDGPLSPHPKVYSSLLCVLADRVDSPDAEPEDIARSVSDAKYVWRRHMRSLEKGLQDHIEPRSVDAIIKVLSRGEPHDRELMFDILRDVCELPRPGEDRPSSPSPWAPPKVAPTTWILNEALHGCIVAGQPDKAVHYAQSVMSSGEQRAILNRWHLQNLVHAHVLLAREGSTSSARAENVAEWVEWMVTRGQDEKLARTRAAIAQALELCYRCEDVKSGLRIARAMLEGPMRGSIPVGAWVYLLKLAIVAPREEKRRCLELLSAHGSVLDVWESTSAIEQLEPSKRKAHVSLALCIVQVLRTISPSLPPDQENDGGGGGGDAELGQQKPEVWSDLRRRAESFLENGRQPE